MEQDNRVTVTSCSLPRIADPHRPRIVGRCRVRTLALGTDANSVSAVFALTT